MFEYRVIKKDYKVLNQLGKDGWDLSCIDGEHMIFKKKVTIKRNKEVAVDTPEWNEFKDMYRSIKTNGLYNDTLKVKYNKLVKEGLHKEIMKNLKDYTTYLEVKKKKDYALMASTYINQARYKDTWEVVADMSKKFINDIYKEKNLNADEISYMNTEISAYETKHSREVTDGNVRNIIQVRLNK